MGTQLTGDGHVVKLRGITGEGIYVNDPYGERDKNTGVYTAPTNNNEGWVGFYSWDEVVKYKMGVNNAGSYSRNIQIRAKGKRIK